MASSSFERKKWLAVLAYLLLDEEDQDVKEKKKKRIWARNWLLRRQQRGCYYNLQKELLREDSEGYKAWLRMDHETFIFILKKIEGQITKKNTVMRKSIAAEERLSITLRYLATGHSFKSLGFHFRMSPQVIGKIVAETCQAINRSLMGEIKLPANWDLWRSVASDFSNQWNFPHCIGAIDGKHIQVYPPPNTGSTYFNYKGHFSNVLLAVVGSDYEFLYIDVGTNGRVSDGGVWRSSKLLKLIEEDDTFLPPPTALSESAGEIPYYLVGDEAIPLKPSLMKPYPSRSLTNDRRIFNYRLSRARRIVENAFGILSNRWRIYQAPINLAPEKVTQIVITTFILHNLIWRRCQNKYIPTVAMEDSNLFSCPSTFKPVTRYGSNASLEAKEVMEVNNEGAVDWQWQYAI